jgi:methylmalonyl-CoA/ethylmalonyl-CoA epimerase
MTIQTQEGITLRNPIFGGNTPAALFYDDMLDHIDHIGIAVADMESAIHRYSILGLRLTHDETIEAQGTRAVFMSAPGGADIELLAPLAEDTPIGKFLTKRGPGMHHICYAVVDLPAAIAFCHANGFEMIDTQPRVGAKGKRLAFIHPKAMDGVLIELYEQTSHT